MRGKINYLFWEYILIFLLILSLTFDFLLHKGRLFLFAVAVFGSLQTLLGALRFLRKRRISIDTFNVFVLVVSFTTGEIRSAAFIVLMLSFARILNKLTESRSHRAIEELLKLKPMKAVREQNGIIEEILNDNVRSDDILIVEAGSRIPVDGIIVFGSALINEASVTGESLPVEKVAGDIVLGSTLNESGVIKIRARRVGKDSTLERMITLTKEAEKNKSHSEKLSDKFASFFLPIVAVAGLITYILTRNMAMTVSLFLVACAEDMAVAIPLAITASIGRAAKRGVIIKGGEWLNVLAKVKTLVLDKTGTLTFGKVFVKEIRIEPGVNENDFWKFVGTAEKFSEHPIGRSLFREALKHVRDIPDPDRLKVYKGSGIVAECKGEKVAIGDESIIFDANINIDKISEEKIKFFELKKEGKSLVFINEKLAGMIGFADMPRPHAKGSLEKLKAIGVKNIIMFTGDNKEIAADVANNLGIQKFHSSMTPENKLYELESLEISEGPVGMVGDGVNDAPALSRADVGIAMGGIGTAAAVEAADIVILVDDLSRIPEIIILSRKTVSVVKNDMWIWFFSNVIGFTLVLTGIFGPALAAFYNFITDFFPLVNSMKLFRKN